MPLKLQIDEPSNLNLTSMIDVLFLLIMFFMVATKFTDLERQVSIELPKVGPSDSNATARRLRDLNVFKDGTIEINGVHMNETNLKQAVLELKATNPGLIINVRPDGDSASKSLVNVFFTLDSAGVEFKVAATSTMKR